jgi:hypothetical protein
MNLLFTGRGTSGSWQVRGEQLGAACGAVVAPNATLAQCEAADLIVAVKKLRPETLAAIRASGRPWVLDVVDFFPQPECAAWSREESIAWVRQKLEVLKPSAVIWPNRRMREDCDTGLPGMVLRHHHRPGIARNPIREQVALVGYEGREAYIAKWRSQIEHECHRRGWRFVVNPERMADLDIVLALRCGPWDSYAGKHWKSNVKLANAHASGTPFIGQTESAYLETASGAEYWTASAAGLGVCFEWLASQSTREQVSDRFVQKAYPVERAAADLGEWLRGL